MSSNEPIVAPVTRPRKSHPRTVTPHCEQQLRRAMRHLFKAQDELALATHELTHLARTARDEGGDFQRVATRYALATKATTEHLVAYAKSLAFWAWYARHRADELTTEEEAA